MLWPKGKDWFPVDEGGEMSQLQSFGFSQAELKHG